MPCGGCDSPSHRCGCGFCTSPLLERAVEDLFPTCTHQDACQRAFESVHDHRKIVHDCGKIVSQHVAQHSLESVYDCGKIVHDRGKIVHDHGKIVYDHRKIVYDRGKIVSQRMAQRSLEFCRHFADLRGHHKIPPGCRSITLLPLELMSRDVHCED